MLRLRLSFLIIFLSFAGLSHGFGTNAKIGQPAPEFQGTTHDGKTVSLKDYRGRYVVLEWYSSICPCSNNHYRSGNIQKLQKKFGKNVAWLTVSSHAAGTSGAVTKESVDLMIFNKYKATPTAFLMDQDGTIGNLYGAQSTPQMFVINPEGQIIYKGAFDNKVKDAESYSPTTSQNFVEQALDAALAGKKIELASTAPYGCLIKYKAPETAAK